jgi:GMP synthase (glutamine-hydrolysing)
MALRLLVVEGNLREAREAYKAGWGKTPSESYAQVLGEIAADVVCDLCFPADPGANLPDAAGLEGYDGVVLTGSALNIYDGHPGTRAQIDFARAIFRSGTPFFGSCWGLQVASAAAGGDVIRNPNGREAGVARALVATQSGAGHPLLAGRGATWDAPCHHLDVVAAPPPGATVLAYNANSPVQAAEIAHDGGVFWGVQYHPEFALGEVAAVLRRAAPGMIRDGLFADESAASRYCDALATLHADPARADLAFALGVQPEILDARYRTTEIRNFLDNYARPAKSRRGRA